jgi:hypothetical protein
MQYKHRNSATEIRGQKQNILLAENGEEKAEGKKVFDEHQCLLCNFGWIK